MAADDPRLTGALAAVGLPQDLVPVIEREQDAPDSSGEGGGGSPLDAPARAVRFTFLRADDGSWYRYRDHLRQGPVGAAAHPVLPLELALGRPGSEVVARLGEPTLRALLGPHRRERDDFTLVVDDDEDDAVRRVHRAMRERALQGRVEGQGR